MDARQNADAAFRELNLYGGALEDADRTDNGLAVVLASRALCRELRALSVLIDYKRGDS